MQKDKSTKRFAYIIFMLFHLIT